jgi:hypothetical protein
MALQAGYSAGELVNIGSNDSERMFEAARMITTVYLGCFMLVAVRMHLCWRQSG